MKATGKALAQAAQTALARIPPRAAAAPPGDAMGAMRTPWILGLVTIFAFFVVGGVMAATIPLSKAVIAEGVIAAEGLRRAVRSLEAGVIDEIAIAEGDAVREGEVVLRLEDRRIQAELAAAEQRLRQLAARESRLLAERDGDDVIAFAHAALATTENAEVGRLLQAEQKLFEARRESRTTEERMLGVRVNQLESQVSGQELRFAALQQQKGLISQEIRDINGLVRQGLSPKSRLLALQRAEAELNGAIGEAKTDIASSQEAIGGAMIERAALTATYLERVAAELVETQTDRFETEKQITTLRDRLEKTQIRAIANGHVIALQHASAGAVISAGEVLFEIVPDQETVMIEARVRPQDIDGVESRMPARIHFSSLSGDSVDRVEGAITHISADVFEGGKNDERYYKVFIQASEDDLNAKIPNFSPVIGMPAQVYIVSGTQTVIEYISRPLRTVINRGLSEE